MVGLGETYLAAFILALGFSALSSALVTTLPLICGALIQLLSPWGVRWLGSYRLWVVSSARIQATSCLLFAFAAWNGNLPEWTLYIISSVYWGSSLATGPAWNAWINALVPKAIRTSYFAHRTRSTHASVLIGLLLGGTLLEFGRKNGLTVEIFCLLFLISGVLRFLSAHYLSQQSEPAGLAKKIHVLSIRETTKKIVSSNYGKILAYLFFLQIAVHFSSGFLNAFMLSEIGLSYQGYTIVIGSLVLAKVLSMPLILRWIQAWGLSRVLMISAIGIVPMPLLWLVHDSLLYLVALQFFGGVVWAAHELAVFLILFGEIPAEDRTSVLSEFNFFHTFGVVLGASLGGILFYSTGQNSSAYILIFSVSVCLRLISLLWLPSVNQPIRTAGLRIYQRAISVRPGGGAGILRPLITMVPTSRESKQTSKAPRSKHPTPR